MIPSFPSSPGAKRQRAILLTLSLFAAVFLLIQFHTASTSKNIGSDVVFAPRYKLSASINANTEAFSSYKLNLPLFEAVKSNNIQLVQSLLQGSVQHNQQNYNVNAEDAQGITPIIEASLLGNIQMVELLLAHGATAQPAPGFRHTPLRAACLTANLPLIRLLVDRGADVNAQSEGGRTPLMGACYLRPQFDALPDRGELSYQACQLMLQLGANPHITNSFGESALDLCVNRGYSKSVTLLKKWWNERRYARMGNN
jgi:ankyrin repeat protein